MLLGSLLRNAPSLREIDAWRATISLAEFVRQAWETVEPGEALIWNWHIEAICEHLEAVTRGEILRLIINIPPGHAKSLLVGVFWPAWEWIERPKERSLFSSYALNLAIRDSVRCRDLIKSDWYQQAFEPDWEIKKDQDAKSLFVNTSKGFRMALSVGSGVTGHRGNKVVVDDPLNVIDKRSKVKREEAVFWWDKAMSSRLNNMRLGKKVVIMQRLHEMDLTGHLLKKGGYEHLCLPSEFEPGRRCTTKIGWTDPRKEEGETLFPELFPPEVLEQAKVDLGSEDYAGQHQQRPSPAEGIILKRKWWKYFVVRPLHFDEVIESWDMNFKDTDGTDYVVGQVWGRVGARKYLLYQYRARIGFSATCEAVKSVSEAYPDAHAKLVEDKANGPAVIDALSKTVSGLIAVEPDGSKEARAWAIQPDLEAGNIFLPALSLEEGEEPLLEFWVEEFIERCAAFPKVEFDDEIDACTQAITRLRQEWGVSQTATIV